MRYYAGMESFDFDPRTTFTRGDPRSASLRGFVGRQALVALAVILAVTIVAFIGLRLPMVLDPLWPIRNLYAGW